MSQIVHANGCEMTHAPVWWYVWLGVVLLFGVMSLLRRHGGRLPPRPGRLRSRLGR